MLCAFPSSCPDYPHAGTQFCVYSLISSPREAFLLPHTDSWALTLSGAQATARDATRAAEARAMHGLSGCLSEVQGPSEAAAPGQAGATSRSRDSNDCAALPSTPLHSGTSWERLKRRTTPMHHRARPQDMCKVQHSPGMAAAGREQCVLETCAEDMDATPCN